MIASRSRQAPRVVLREVPIYLYQAREEAHFAHCSGCQDFAHTPVLFTPSGEGERWSLLSEGERWEEIKCRKGCRVKGVLNLPTTTALLEWVESHRKSHTGDGKRAVVVLRRGER